MHSLRAETLAALAPGVTASPASALAVARLGLWALLAAHVVAAWGTQWDIQWHLLIGRDSFWIPPHVITYSGVTAIALVSFGVLAWTTARALAGTGREPGMIRVMGLTGTPGYHLAALGIALTVLAAPIDDLWHRLFGLDVTLWSPPHLLGLLGAVVNAAACWVIAGETYALTSRARLAALVLAGTFVYAALGVSVQPGIRTAYSHGGVLFFTYPVLGALLAPLALVITARLSRMREAPVLVVVMMVLFGTAGAGIARAGFAWIQPVSFIGEEIAKDPTSPIAVNHEIARKNGTTPGAFNPILIPVALLAALAMVAVDARRRPRLAGLAYGVTLFIAFGLVLARLPAFATSLPSMTETAVAAVLTALAGLGAGAIACRMTPDDPAKPRTGIYGA